ncbi:HPr kinase/phosphorylase [Acuticoccus yangtzensis]|uniref:HPr kinase/phosphorylase n=1 Tax=Acuticoccus yangtzensis TaxID=1443441 RepID=UPI0009FAF6AD|nr:HPr kinase/phosphatase C-terminal domain-containing protein [Acuticoccus yangtzensis]
MSATSSPRPAAHPAAAAAHPHAQAGHEPVWEGPTVHASAVALGGDGVLITGASGAGKSALARALVAHFTGRGLFARLVADDRVRLAALNGRLIARTPRRIAGLVEVREVGIVPVRHLAAVRLSLLVDLAVDPPRMPEIGAERRTLEGITLPALCLSQRTTPLSVLAVASQLAADGLTDPTRAPQRPPS